MKPSSSLVPRGVKVEEARLRVYWICHSVRTFDTITHRCLIYTALTFKRRILNINQKRNNHWGELFRGNNPETELRNSLLIARLAD